MIHPILWGFGTGTNNLKFTGHRQDNRDRNTVQERRRIHPTAHGG